jgi:signal transduction histidine kinase
MTDQPNCDRTDQVGIPLLVLMVEDSADDAELVALELRRGGYDARITRVDTKADTEEALASGRWDLVLSDYARPGFSGLAALELVKARGLDVPFLLVSGAIGEEVAVAAMKAGAHDYLLKRNLARLVPAVARELQEAVVRRERRRAEDSLRFLAEWGVMLAESLDYRTTLANVSRLAVPFLADWCTIHLVDDAGAIQRVAMAHADPKHEPTLRELHEGYPPAFASNVLRTSVLELFPHVSDAVLEASGVDPAQVRLIRALETESVIAVPLVARGKNIGAITLGSAASRPRYETTNTALAQELVRRAALAIDNARLYHEAQDAIRLREDFLAIASHELRTPLMPLLLEIQSLQRRVRESATGEEWLPQRLVAIHRHTERVIRLVDNLLDISRIAGGHLHLDPESVDLSETVRQVVGRFEESGDIGRAHCQLRVRTESRIAGHWDRTCVEQIVTNLLSNALKFGAGKPIDIVAESRAASAMLIVTDFGIGIAPEDHERIFARFERAVSRQNYGGFGMGLFIVRQIVEAMGGSVRVASSADGGTVFTVSLPLEHPLRGASSALAVRAYS